MISAAAAYALAGPVIGDTICAEAAQHDHSGLGSAVAAPSVSSNLPQFEVASIKLWDPHVRKPQIMVYPSGRVSISHATLDDLIAIAFRVHPFQVSGGAKWTGNLYYDIEAKAPEDVQWKVAPRYGFDSIEDERLAEMLQALLIDRFQLKFHRATTTGDVYLMERSGKSLKLSPTKAFSAKEDPSTSGDRGWTGIGPTDRGWVLFDVSMQQLADFASGQSLYKPVYDRTKLTGRYDYSSPEGDVTGSTYRSDPAGAFLDLIRDIGLKLVSTKGPVNTFVIDHAEPASPN